LFAAGILLKEVRIEGVFELLGVFSEVLRRHERENAKERECESFHV
jgi:hypothetical protein